MMKIQLRKEYTFEAAHMLPLHDGKCRRLHGHSFKMRVVVEGDVLQVQGSKSGMLMDYADLSAIVKPVVETFLDHHYLNETLKMENPTSELIATWLYHYLKPQIPLLVAIEIDETCTSFCRFTP